MSIDDESPYTIPALFLVLGVVLTAVGLGTVSMDDPPSGAVTYSLIGLGGLIGFIGAVSLAVLLGTDPLRRR